MTEQKALMSNYPSWIVSPTEMYCQADGCSFVPASARRMLASSGEQPELTPRFAVEGTDLCNWHHAQFPRVLADLVDVHASLTQEAYAKSRQQDDAGVRSKGMPSDVGTSWNPHAAAVLAELEDWTNYLVRMVIREEPLPPIEQRTFTRTVTVRDVDGKILHDDTGKVLTYTEDYTVPFQPSHGLDMGQDVRTKLKVLANWHARWWSGYPHVGPFVLADALQHRRLGMRALQAEQVKRITLRNAACQFDLDEDELGPVICGAPLYAIIRPKDDKPSEILCSTNPRHPQLSRADWILAHPRPSR